MAPQKRSGAEEDFDRSADYYIDERNQCDEAELTKRDYSDSFVYLQKLLKGNWEK